MYLAPQTAWTPLLIASSAGHPQIVHFLISHNAQVSVVNQTGQSPLHYAASKGHMEVGFSLSHELS